MSLLKLFLIWLGVFPLSLMIGWLLRTVTPKIGHIQRSFVTSLLLVPAIVYGVLPIVTKVAG